jgi:hypothetical protein
MLRKASRVWVGSKVGRKRRVPDPSQHYHSCFPSTMAAAAPSREAILNLYNSTLRTARSFSSYNFRQYFVRRTQMSFRAIQVRAHRSPAAPSITHHVCARRTRQTPRRCPRSTTRPSRSTRS